jgi:DNA polymerase
MPEDARPGAEEWVPEGAGIDVLREAAKACRGCELWEPATQVVFSAGPPSASIVLVGEQPGDQEDRRGLPFVGPAGQLLVRAIKDAGIDPATVYRTNAVKHFRFEERGARRIPPRRTAVTPHSRRAGTGSGGPRRPRCITSSPVTRGCTRSSAS